MFPPSDNLPVITYRQEFLVNVQKDMQQLIVQHYEELTLHKEVMKLSPDWKSYSALEEQNKLVIMAARDEGMLIGYSFFICGTHLHYKEVMTAHNDVLFLHKDYRKGRVGITLIKRSESLLKSLGVQKVFWHIKDSNNFEPIMKRLGYNKEEVIVSKLI